MPTIDVFSGNAFSLTTLTGIVNKVDHLPTVLGNLGVFSGSAVRGRNVFIDRQSQGLALIADSASGAPADRKGTAARDAVSLRTTRLVKSQKLHAHQLQDIRAFGLENDYENAQAKVAEMLGNLRNDQEFTHEFHRLGAVQGKLLDADGTTVIYDYFAEFAETEEAAINFALSTAATDVAGKCREVIRGMSRAAKGSFTPATRVMALCGDGFWDQLVSHPNIEKFFLNYNASDRLQSQFGAFGVFEFGGITFTNYRGSDDNTTVAVPSDEAKFFPVGAVDFFDYAMGPHETFEAVNQPGQNIYADLIYEREGNVAKSKWVEIETASYPLFICKRPSALRKAVAA